ncbi:MAG: flagellar hook-associated protein FlgL [Clostridiales bacterium]|nr:flagellar hook-associated protein FlgL [Clostridiales bacterium]
MRITNMMMANTMLLNISRNMRYVDNLYTQIATAKKIQVPSDDPITAARALKFRSAVSDTGQFQRNASQALAWMNITESAYNNVVGIVRSIRDRCVQAANGTLTAEDRQAISAQVKQMFGQIAAEMNVTYAGRYTFSGYRTDEPPVLDRSTPAGFNINQSFSPDDVEVTKSYQKPVSGSLLTDPASVYNTRLLKLAYQNVDFTGGGISVPPLTIPGAPRALYVHTVNATDGGVPALGGVNPYDSANIPAGNIVYIQQTGELVMSDADAVSADFVQNGLRVNYDKIGIAQGELNPLVYFSCTDLSTGIGYNMLEQHVAYEFGVNTRVDINSLAADVLTDKLYADLNNLCKLLDRVTISDEQQVTELYKSQGMIGDVLANATQRHLADEKARLSEVLHNRFNNMLEMCDRHMSVISRMQADLGARINRLDLIVTRLDQEEGSYKQLMSDNEDVDMMRAIMLKSNAEAVYQASLKAGASIIQMTLSSFI